MVEAIGAVTGERVLTLGPIVGRRTWQITPRLPTQIGPPTVLRGRRGVGWTGPQLRAVCLEHAGGAPRSLAQGPRTQAPGSHGPAPAIGCRCGIHAHKPGQGERDGWASGPPAPRASGWVELIGTVVEGTRGYRAEVAHLAGPLEVEVACAGPTRHGSGACGAPVVAVVRTDVLSYRVTCGRAGHVPTSGGAVPIEDWLATVIPALATRYGVSVVAFEPTKEETDGHR
jgi:hypothetical protein